MYICVYVILLLTCSSYSLEVMSRVEFFLELNLENKDEEGTGFAAVSPGHHHPQRLQFVNPEWVDRPRALFDLLLRPRRFLMSLLRVAGLTGKSPEDMALCLMKSKQEWPDVTTHLVLDNDYREGFPGDVFRRLGYRDAAMRLEATQEKAPKAKADKIRQGLLKNMEEYKAIPDKWTRPGRPLCDAPSNLSTRDINLIQAATWVTVDRGAPNPIKLVRPKLRMDTFRGDRRAAEEAAVRDYTDAHEYVTEPTRHAEFWCSLFDRKTDAISLKAAMEAGLVLAPLDVSEFLGFHKFPFPMRRIVVVDEKWKNVSLLEEGHRFALSSAIVRPQRGGRGGDDSALAIGLSLSATINPPHHSRLPWYVKARKIMRHFDDVKKRQEEEQVGALATMSGYTPGDFLPLEMLMEVFGYLGRRDLLSASAVNKRWHGAVADLLWKRRPWLVFPSSTEEAYRMDSLKPPLMVILFHERNKSNDLLKLMAKVKDQPAVYALDEYALLWKTGVIRDRHRPLSDPCSFSPFRSCRVHDEMNDEPTPFSILGDVSRECGYFGVSATCVYVNFDEKTFRRAPEPGSCCALLGSSLPGLEFHEAHAVRDEARAGNGISKKIAPSVLEKSVKLVLLFYCGCCQLHVLSEVRGEILFVLLLVYSRCRC